MYSDIERQIKMAKMSIEEGQVDKADLINLAKHCLSNDTEQKLLHELLELGHMRDVSRHMHDEESIDTWFELLVQMIQESNFHVGYMLRQRSDRYRDDTAFNVINKGHLKTLTYSALWSFVVQVGRSISTFEMEEKKP
ncbi:MAG: hypothetical protein QF780_01410, partial [Candidatus Marinimicrobia bacterium]|nr:hypothetical protein [Candidatus Neomarinimicrobiota bacterium]